jgi:hypothetical protein
MIFSRTSFISRIALFAVALPVVGFSAAIEVNGTCEVGNCASPGSVSVGQATSGAYNFNYTVGSDVYQIAGTFFNSQNPAGTPNVGFFPTVTLISGPAASTDSLVIDLVQGFFNATHNIWNGPPPYTHIAPIVLSAGVTYQTGDITFDKGTAAQADIGALPSVTGPASTTESNSKVLTGFPDGTLTEDLSENIQFAKGAPLDSFFSSPSPEPAEYMSLGIGLAGLIMLKTRKLWSPSGKR